MKVRQWEHWFDDAPSRMLGFPVLGQKYSSHIMESIDPINYSVLIKKKKKKNKKHVPACLVCSRHYLFRPLQFCTRLSIRHFPDTDGNLVSCSGTREFDRVPKSHLNLTYLGLWCGNAETAISCDTVILMFSVTNLQMFEKVYFSILSVTCKWFKIWFVFIQHLNDKGKVVHIGQPRLSKVTGGCF